MLLLIGLSIAVIVAAVILFVIYKMSRIEKLAESIDSEYPTTYATIENVKERYVGDNKCYRCDIKFSYDYAREHRTTIDLPYSVVPIPIGGKIKIKTNPDNMSEIILIERTYMNTPEYEAEMRRLGYVRTEYGYELK